MRNKGFSPILVIIVIAILGIGGYLFYRSSVSQKVPNSITPISLVAKCGDMPTEIATKIDRFSVINGPEWSPDCKYIAWSLWESGTSVPNGEATVKKSDSPAQGEGIYLYTVSTKEAKRVYMPQHSDQTPQYIRWEDQNKILFSIVDNTAQNGATNMIYSLSSGTITPK